MVDVDINYSKDQLLHAVRVLRRDGVAVLGNVLHENSLDVVRRLCASGWRHQCIPEKCSYATRKSFLLDLPLPIKTIALPWYRFRSGDYILMHDNCTVAHGYLALLFIDEWDEHFGGHFVLVAKGQTLVRYVPRKNSLLLVRCPKGARYFFTYVNHHGKQFRVISLH